MTQPGYAPCVPAIGWFVGCPLHRTAESNAVSAVHIGACITHRMSSCVVKMSTESLCAIHAAEGEGRRLLPDYETEQLCEKLNLGQLQTLRGGLEEKAGSRAAQQSLLQVRICIAPSFRALCGEKLLHSGPSSVRRQCGLQPLLHICSL